MKFIITVETYNPCKDGVQVITSQFAESLVKRGHKVTVITSDRYGGIKQDIINGVNVLRVNLKTTKSIYMGDRSGYRKMVIKSCEKADVLINVCLQTAFTDILLKKIDEIKIKKVLYLHGMAHFEYPSVKKVDFHDLSSWLLNVTRWKLYYFFIGSKLSNYDYTIHLHSKDKTVDLVKTDKKRKIIFENFINSIKHVQSKRDRKSYICISNFLHDKNQEFVLRAFYISTTERQLIFVGGMETNYLKRLVALKLRLDSKYGFRSVEFKVNEERLLTMQRLENSFAFLNGSKSEKYPVVISESIQNSIPFISTDVGIVRHLKGGFIIKNEVEMALIMNQIENEDSLYDSKVSEANSYAKTHYDYDKNIDNFLKKIGY